MPLTYGWRCICFRRGVMIPVIHSRTARSLRKSPWVAVVALMLFAFPGWAQVPDTLLHSLRHTPLSGTSEMGAAFGGSVAVEGGITVVGISAADVYYPDAGRVRVFNSATGALIHEIINPTPDGMDYFGSSIAISGSRIVVGAPADGGTAYNGPGAAYVYDLASATPTIPILTLLNPTPSAGDEFGDAVAFSGHWIAVGAPGDDTFGPSAGIAYMYDLTSATPSVPVVVLNDPTPVSSGRFGSEIAMSGTRVAVGAQGDVASGINNAGSAFVFDVGGSSASTPVAILEKPAPAQSDYFGSSVAISGTWVVVGAYGAESAYVFDLAGSTLTVPVAVLNDPTATDSGYFGISVSISGTLVVAGAPLSNHGATDGGAAFVFDLAGADPAIPVAVFENPNATSWDYFGGAVAISGTRVEVGAPRTGSSGRAYLFDVSAPASSIPLAQGAATNESFGASTVVSGDFIVVGAPKHTSSLSVHTHPGRVFVFDMSGALVRELINPAPADSDFFGLSLAASGTFVVVSHARTGGYVYDLAGTTPDLPVATLPIPAEFRAYSVAISGTKVALGAEAPAQNGASGIIGRVFVYDLAGATPSVPVWTLNGPSALLSVIRAHRLAMHGDWVVAANAFPQDGGGVSIFNLASSTPTVPSLVLTNPVSGGGFGFSVALFANTLAVGAADSGNTPANRVYLYNLAGPTPYTPNFTLISPEPSSGGFGNSVSISGTQVMVGAPYDTSAVPNSGKAYLFDLAGATPSLPIATFHNPKQEPYNHFGSSVTLAGSTAVVGAPRATGDSPGDRNGRTYIFGPSGTFTAPPTLNAPAADSTLGSEIHVAFALPENALPGSVQLSFGGTVLTLAASQETVGPHSFSFDPANPTASPQIANGGPVQNGTYAVTLRYQDALGNAAASSVSENVTLNAVGAPDVTLLPTLTSPAPKSIFPRTMSVSFVLPEAAQPGSVKLSFGTSVLSLAPTHESAGTHSFTFDSTNPTASPSIVSGEPILEGNSLVILSYRDLAGNAPATAISTPVTVDRVALPPTLTSPSANTTVTSTTTNVSFSLPERAQPGSVTLNFGPHALVLSFENVGTHTFTFNPAHPTTSSSITSGASVPDGTYTVTLSYRDALGNPAESAPVANVTVNARTLAPTLHTPAANSRSSFPIFVSFTLPEAANVGTLRLSIGSANYSLAASHCTAGFHSFWLTPPVSNHLPDGTYDVRLSYSDTHGNPQATDVSENFSIDHATQPPVIVAPAFASKFAGVISFHLPEPALDGSLRLRIGTRTFPLATSQHTAGAHSFPFDPTNPTASPEVTSGDPIPDGTYTFALVYQDTLGHPQAQTVVGGVYVDATRITLPPALTSPRSNTSYATSASVAFSLPEAALPGSLQLSFGDTVLTLAASQATAGAHSLSFNLANPTASPEIASGGPVPDGIHTVTLSYRDIHGNTPATAQAVNVETVAVLPEPATMLLASKGAPVPGAGNGTSGIPAGTVWEAFGVPSVTGGGPCAVLATLLSGTVKTTAILAWDAADMEGTIRVVAKTGDTVLPGAIISAMKDPALGTDGIIAWPATLANTPGTPGAVTSTNDSVILASSAAAGLNIIAREGTVAPGTTDAVWSGFTSLAVGRASVAFMAKLRTGTPGVTLTSDTGLWACDIAADGSQTTSLALREGDAMLGSTVRVIGALTARAGSSGQGRGTVFDGSQDRTAVRVSLADGRQAVGSVAQDGTANFPYVTGNPVGGPYSSSVQWRLFGLPTQNATSGAMSFISSWGTLPVIFVEDDTTYEPTGIVEKLSPAPGGGSFNTFKDPVSAGGRKVAFIGSLATGGSITATTNEGVWFYDTAGGTIVAREGTQAAEAPAGATWKSFTSLALPEDRGPLFTAKLQGPGITTTNDDALWATDRFGLLRLIAREGDTLGTSTVKIITVLSSVTGSPAQTRSFADGGEIILRITDAAGAQHLLSVSVP